MDFPTLQNWLRDGITTAVRCGDLREKAAIKTKEDCLEIHKQYMPTNIPNLRIAEDEDSEICGSCRHLKTNPYSSSCSVYPVHYVIQMEEKFKFEDKLVCNSFSPKKEDEND